MRLSTRTHLRSVALHAVLLPLALVWLLPIWMMVVFSTMPDNAIFSADILMWPSTGLMDNLAALHADSNFLVGLRNSIVVGIVGTLSSMTLASMAGWALARYAFVGKRAVLMIVFGTLTLPYFVVVIPQFVMVARYFDMANTWFALIVPPLFNALGVMLMRQAFITMPAELFDAARVEGVSEWKIFLHVALPLARPTLAALAIILFLASWNNYLWPLIIANSPDMATAPVALGSLVGLTRVSWGAIMAGALALTVPMLIVFALLQRHFIAGITAGAVK